jgi:hypothetical protein
MCSTVIYSNYTCNNYPITIIYYYYSSNGGTHKDVETRIQKARGAFTRLRKIWMAHYVNKDTKIKLFSVYVKSGTTIQVPNLAGYM